MQRLRSPHVLRLLVAVLALSLLPSVLAGPLGLRQAAEATEATRAAWLRGQVRAPLGPEAQAAFDRALATALAADAPTVGAFVGHFARAYAADYAAADYATDAVEAPSLAPVAALFAAPDLPPDALARYLQGRVPALGGVALPPSRVLRSALAAWTAPAPDRPAAPHATLAPPASALPLQVLLGARALASEAPRTPSLWSLFSAQPLGP